MPRKDLEVSPGKLVAGFRLDGRVGHLRKRDLLEHSGYGEPYGKLLRALGALSQGPGS